MSLDQLEKNASNLQGKPIIKVCAGYRDQETNVIYPCEKVKDSEGWMDIDAFEMIYGNVDFNKYALSHGLCPDCRDKTYEQIKQLHKKQGK